MTFRTDLIYGLTYDLTYTEIIKLLKEILASFRDFVRYEQNLCEII